MRGRSYKPQNSNPSARTKPGHLTGDYITGGDRAKKEVPRGTYQ